ncbi:hypothetical protein [Enterococcus sp. AZ109]|uniref:hypothetical protein n=1 Tax=Enterococcus sp. AZ109 TaxID=2774634 RepID=UPI003F259651
MVNYYLTIMTRENMTAAEAEKYIKTKVSIIWRKKVQQEWNKLQDEKAAAEDHS